MKQKILSTSVLTFSLLIFLIGAGCNKPTSNYQEKSESVGTNMVSGFSLYEDTTAGFRIQYPQNWEKKVGYSGTLISFVSPEEPNLNVISEDAQNLDLDKYVQASVESIKSFPEFKLIELNKAQLGNQEAKSVIYTRSTEKGTKLYVRQFFTIKNGTAFIVTITNTQDSPEKFLATSMQMIESFEFTK